MKTCTKCGVTKPLSEFHNCASKKDGKFPACKDCRNAYGRAKAEEIGHDVIWARTKARLGEDALRQQRRDYYLRNQERIKAKTRAWGAANPERKKQNRIRHYEENKARYEERAKKWAEGNRPRRRKIALDYQKRMRRERPEEYVAVQSARKMVARVLVNTGRKKRGRTYEILGYNKQDFVRHIESLFQDGMTWDNHGEWHIDHIIPVSELVKSGVTDPAKINALANLRPIWAHENHVKHARFELAPPEAGFITKAGK